MRDIVVGVDGSAPSSRALSVAAVQADRAGTTLRAVHGYYTPMWVRAGPRDHWDLLETPLEGTEYAEKLVHGQIEELHARHPELNIKVVSEVLDGEPREKLLEISQDTDLLVIASRGLSRVRGLLLGSVAHYLLTRSACPLLLVPAEGPEPVPPQRVVVGADGSSASREAMRWGLGAAHRHGCALVILHAGNEKVCQEWLDGEVANALPERSAVEVHTELVHASPVVALRGAVGKDDLLVLGRRGGGGFNDLALGSVASQCAHHATSLLVVVPEERSLR